MIRGSREDLKKVTTSKKLLKEIEGYSSDDLVMVIMTAPTYKSRKQNNLFHSLLSIFWHSGCSSFNDYEELRNHYKKLAGLIYTKETKVGETKIIHRIEKSWSDVKKEQATDAIETLLEDMDQSAVIGSKMTRRYELVLRELGLWFDFN